MEGCRTAGAKTITLSCRVTKLLTDLGKTHARQNTSSFAIIVTRSSGIAEYSRRKTWTLRKVFRVARRLACAGQKVRVRVSSLFGTSDLNSSRTFSTALSCNNSCKSVELIEDAGFPKIDTFRTPI